MTHKKPLYNEIMEAFWREVNVPAEPSRPTLGPTTPTIDTVAGPTMVEPRPGHGLGAVEDDTPVGLIPEETRSGTYHLGAD